MKPKAKVKKSPTRKDMQKELDMFRKLSMHMVANKIFLEYKLASSIMSIEPEGFMDECIELNFPRLASKVKDEIWRFFLANLVMSRRKVTK